MGHTVRPKNAYYPVEPNVDPLRLGQLWGPICISQPD
jgi:hypothetical protein